MAVRRVGSELSWYPDPIDTGDWARNLGLIGSTANPSDAAFFAQQAAVGGAPPQSIMDAWKQREAAQQQEQQLAAQQQIQAQKLQAALAQAAMSNALGRWKTEGQWQTQRDIADSINRRWFGRNVAGLQKEQMRGGTQRDIAEMKTGSTERLQKERFTHEKNMLELGKTLDQANKLEQVSAQADVQSELARLKGEIQSGLNTQQNSAALEKMRKRLSIELKNAQALLTQTQWHEKQLQKGRLDHDTQMQIANAKSRLEQIITGKDLDLRNTMQTQRDAQAFQAEEGRHKEEAARQLQRMKGDQAQTVEGMKQVGAGKRLRTKGKQNRQIEEMRQAGAGERLDKRVGLERDKLLARIKLAERSLDQRQRQFYLQEAQKWVKESQFSGQPLSPDEALAYVYQKYGILQPQSEPQTQQKRQPETQPPPSQQTAPTERSVFTGPPSWWPLNWLRNQF